MYPHMLYGYARSNPAGYPARSPLFWGFGAPLVGGLLGGFLGSAIFNYPRPYAYPPPYPYYGGVPGAGPYYGAGPGGIPYGGAGVPAGAPYGGAPGYR
ncbi:MULTISPECIES: hypothetical protein [unclassified Bacillus (in: firmicutes)]|uniref:hypothetical protein n=1 Tax=unclassified Bacillus (in: firmicutes) TaxID=185979 RepID=UPI00047A51DD|nr:hypothetical protein [Bacillus sp. NSP9.1]QHZ49109.1 hypothetical protein M654_013885 [Bacillus sp. NSP9.1]